MTSLKRLFSVFLIITLLITGNDMTVFATEVSFEETVSGNDVGEECVSENVSGNTSDSVSDNESEKEEAVPEDPISENEDTETTLLTEEVVVVSEEMEFSLPAEVTATGSMRSRAADIAYGELGTVGGSKYYATGESGPYCVYFARYCVRKAGLTADKWSGTGSTTTLISFFQGLGRWHDKVTYKWSYSGRSGGGSISSYVPQPGDFVAIENNGNTADGPGHTGLVYSVNPAANELVTIEGNVSNKVVKRKYTLDTLFLKNGSTWENQNVRIVGVGEPDYGEGRMPVYCCDAFIGDSGKIIVRGWVFDYDAIGEKIEILVEINGKYYTIKTGVYRPDVNKAYGGNVGDYNGFEAEIKVPDRGSHKVTLYAVDKGEKTFGNVKMGSGTVNITNLPFTITYAKSSLSTKVGEKVDLSYNFTGDGIYTMGYTMDDYSILEMVGFSSVDWTNGTANVVLKGTKGGSTNIYIYLMDSNNKTLYSKGIKVTVTQPVTGVSLSKTSTTLNVGKTEKLTATVSPSTASNKNVTWTSSNTNVATVSNGTITAKAVGTATITVKTSDGGYKATCTVTVKQLVTGVSLDKNSITLDPGYTEKLIATISPSTASNKNVTWTSSNTSIATVSGDGTVTAKGPGTATITVKTNDGSYTDTCKVTVKQPVTGITLDKTSLNLLVNEEATLTATVLPDNARNKNVLWWSDNKNIVTVNTNGKVTAVAEGTATITASTQESGFEAKCMVTVTAPKEAEVVLFDGEGRVGSSTSLIYYAELHGEEMKTKTWASSDSTIVSIDESTGVMQLLKPGIATITLTINNVSATAKMKVISFSLSEEEITLEEGEQKELTATVLPDMDDYSVVSWESEDGEIASVKDGIVTAHKEGQTNVTVSYGPYSEKCIVSVTKAPVDEEDKPQEDDPQEDEPQEDEPQEDTPQESEDTESDPDSEEVQEEESEDEPEEDIVSDVPEGLWLTGLETNVTYTGQAITQNVQVYHGAMLLRENVDYKISYKNNKNAGTASLIVTGKNNYTGKVTETFEIEEIDFETDPDVVVHIATMQETGKKLKPKVTVTWKGKKLKEKKDYTLAYDKNIVTASEGGYDITITAKGNYTGVLDEKFYVVSKEIPLLNSATVTGISDTYYYTNGEEVGPNIDAIEVRMGEVHLVKGIDYLVDVENNRNVGTGTVIIKAAGSSYAGEKRISFNIVGTNLTNASITGLNESYVYTGLAIKPEITVYSGTEGTKTIVPSDAYNISYKNNINQGTATVTVTGLEEKGVSGKLKATFKITKLSIASDNVTVKMPDTVKYAKGGTKPVPTITYSYNGKTWRLREGVDYSLKYSNNTSKNKKGTLKINGLGNFSKSTTVYYEIVEQDLSALTMTVTEKAYKEDKKAGYYLVNPKIYDKDGVLLKKNKDYTVKYVDPYTRDAIGKNDTIEEDTEILVIATGKGNYCGEVEATYWVSVSKDISKVKYDRISNQQYTGKSIEPEISLYAKEDGEKVYLQEGCDFEVIGYYNNVKKGKATVVVKGIGDYSGSKVINFKIVSANSWSIWEGLFN